MHLPALVFDRHGDLRSGGRIFCFMGLSGTLFLLLAACLIHLRVASDFTLRIAGIAGIAAATHVMTRFVNLKPFAAIGLLLSNVGVRQFCIGCLLGFLMITGIFLVEYFLGYAALLWGEHSALQYMWIFLSGGMFFMVGAVFEELLFRGYLFQTLMQGLTFLPALLVMMVLFAASHAWNPNMTAWGFVNVALAAAWLSFAYLKTRALWLPIGLHFSWNFSQGTLYSFPTSGISPEGLSLATLLQRGPASVTGGTFGPEGGVLGTLALIMCTWYVLKSKTLAPPREIVTLDSPEDLLVTLRGSTGDPSQQGDS